MKYYMVKKEFEGGHYPWIAGKLYLGIETRQGIFINNETGGRSSYFDKDIKHHREDGTIVDMIFRHVTEEEVQKHLFPDRLEQLIKETT